MANRDIFRLGYNFRMEADDSAELMLYGEIIQDMPEAWKWSKEDKSAADFNRAVKEIRSKGAKKLLLRINSPGGVCSESIAMRSILANAGFDEINIRIEGLCASAATDIATLPGAHVSIAEGSEYMIHNPWCWACGTANEMEKTIDHLRNIEQVTRGFYAKRSGQSEEQITKWMDAETWFTAEQAVEYGFCDEVISADTNTKAVACVSDRAMLAMRGLYKSVPEQIAVSEPPKGNSNASPVAGAATENKTKEEKGMDIKELNLEQLEAENPALLAQIQQNAVAADRQRCDDIDALTLPGYEAMAEEAKRNGTSVLDFQKKIVQAQRQKGVNFLISREAETEPAKNVVGGASSEVGKNADDDIKETAKSVAEYAKAYKGGADSGMF